MAKWKRDQPGCDACGCVQLMDEFESDTITDYTQTRGTWTISDGSLQTTGDDNLIVANTTGELYQNISTRFKSPDMTAVAVFAGYQALGVHYRVIITYGAAGTDDPDRGCGTMKIWRYPAFGSPTQIGPTAYLDKLFADDWHILTVCITAAVPTSNEVTVTASLTVEEVAQSISTALPDFPSGESGVGYVAPVHAGKCVAGVSAVTAGNQVGVGTESSSGETDRVYFDYLSWSDSKSESKPNCPVCACDCIVAVDTFDRENDSDFIGCLWESQVGLWEISEETLVCTSGNHAYVKFLPEYAEDDNQFNQVDVWLNYGSTAFLCLDGVGDTQIRLGLKAGPNDTGVLEITDAGPGGDPLVYKNLSIDAGVKYQIQFCLQKERPTGTGPPRFVGAVFGPSGLYETIEWVPSEVDDNLFGGVGAHTSGGIVRFDNYTNASAAAQCGSCRGATATCKDTGCADEVVPVRFKATSPDMAEGTCGSCDSMGTTWLLGKFGESYDDGSSACSWMACTDRECGQLFWRGNANCSQTILFTLDRNFDDDTITVVVVWEFSFPLHLGALPSFWYRWETSTPRPQDCRTLSVSVPYHSSSSADDPGNWRAPNCDASGTSFQIEAL